MSWKDKRYGNPGALERTLALMGAKTLSEAIDKKKTSCPIDTASQPMNMYETMKRAISDISKVSAGVDYSTYDEDRIRDLSKMPITSIDEINLWRDAWLRLLKVQK